MSNKNLNTFGPGKKYYFIIKTNLNYEFIIYLKKKEKQTNKQTNN